MKKAALYFVFFLVCINNISLHQIWKLPMLVEHFKDHHQRDNKVSIIDFLSMHYWGKDINDNDDAQDMKLPFKDFHNTNIQPIFFSGAKVFTIQVALHNYKKHFPSIRNNFLPDAYLTSLYRPPQA